VFNEIPHAFSTLILLDVHWAIIQRVIVCCFKGKLAKFGESK